MTQAVFPGSGSQVRSTSLAVVQVEAWPTRRVAGQMLGCSIAQIRKYEKRKKLNAVSDANGVWHFNPDEIEQLADELGLGDDENSANDRANAYARVDLINSIKLLRTVTGPQEQIHNRTMAMYDRQAAENERLWKRVTELEAALDAARKVTQEADDRVWERQALKGMIDAKEARTTEVVTRLVESVGKFVNGTGTPFLHTLSEQQAVMLWSVLDDFAPAQQQAIKDAVAKLGFDPTKWGKSLVTPSEAAAGGEPAPPGQGAEGAPREAPGGAGAAGTSGAQSAKP